VLSFILCRTLISVLQPMCKARMDEPASENPLEDAGPPLTRHTSKDQSKRAAVPRIFNVRNSQDRNLYLCRASLGNLHSSSWSFIADTYLALLQACLSCQQRKVRCDGAQPVCANCSRRNAECEYSAVRKLRGAGKRYSLLQIRVPLAYSCLACHFSPLTCDAPF
jgi:hypothetical protein